MVKLDFIAKTLATRSKPTPNLLSENDAAEWLGVSIFTVQRERKRGIIGYTMIGSRARYSIADLQAYVDSKSSKPCHNNDFKSENTTSPNTKTLPYGKPLGTTPIPDKQSALALAQKTFTKPKSA